MSHEYTTIYGKHAVREALSARPDIVRFVYVEAGFDEAHVLTLLKKNNITTKELHTKKLPKDVPKDAVHQGIVAEISAEKLLIPFDDFVRDLDVTQTTGLALLGEIQDPQNVGAIIRSAAAFGVAGVLVPMHRQTQITGAVVKVSVGAAFRVPLVSVPNVNHAIRMLKERGFWIYGLEGEAPQSLADEHFEKPSVFIIGNEATGIRQKTLEHCDIPLCIPMTRNTESLNAAAAAAVVFYAWSTHRR